MSRHPFLELHASDRDQCLSRLRAELDGAGHSGLAADIGTAVHRVAEAVTLELLEHPAADAREVAQATLKTVIRELDLPPAGIVDALEILDKVLAYDSRIRLGVEPGWSGKPEVRWALDADMEIVPPCDHTLGEILACADGAKAEAQPVACARCRAHPGWSRPTLAAGTIALLVWNGTALRVSDYKSERGFRSPDNAFEDWQARLYCLAAFAMFPEARTCEFRFVMLRHSYNATADFVRGDPWAWSVETRLRAMREQRERAVAEQRFPETPGPWCSWCVRMHVCGALDALRTQGTVPEDSNPPELARRWKALQRLTGEYEKHVEALFEDHERDEPIVLGDARGSVLGWKPTQAWELVEDYESTLARLRDFVPAEAWQTTWETHFRFCLEKDFAGRVRKVLKDLRVTEDVLDTFVLPIAKPMLKVFVPEVTAAAVAPTLEDVDELVDRYFG